MWPYVPFLFFALCVLLLSLTIMFLKFIQILVCVRASLLFMIE